MGMLGGLLSPEVKHRDERRRDGGRRDSSPRAREWLEGSPVWNLDWDRERSQDRGRDRERTRDREQDRTREEGDRGRPRDSKDEPGFRGGGVKGEKSRVDGGA